MFDMVCGRVFAVIIIIIFLFCYDYQLQRMNKNYNYYQLLFEQYSCDFKSKVLQNSVKLLEIALE